MMHDFSFNRRFWGDFTLMTVSSYRNVPFFIIQYFTETVRTDIYARKEEIKDGLNSFSSIADLGSLIIISLSSIWFTISLDMKEIFYYAVKSWISLKAGYTNQLKVFLTELQQTSTHACYCKSMRAVWLKIFLWILRTVSAMV